MADLVPRNTDVSAGSMLASDKAAFENGTPLYKVRETADGARDTYVTLPRLAQQWMDGFNRTVSVPISQPQQQPVRNYLIPFPEWPSLSGDAANFVPVQQLGAWSKTLFTAKAANAAQKKQFEYVARLLRLLRDDESLKELDAATQLQRATETGSAQWKLAQKTAATWQAKSKKKQPSSSSSSVGNARPAAFVDAVNRVVAMRNSVRDALARSGGLRLSVSENPKRWAQGWVREARSDVDFVRKLGSRQRLFLPLFEWNSGVACAVDDVGCNSCAVDSFLASAMALYRRLAPEEIAAIDQHYVVVAAREPVYGQSLAPPLPNKARRLADSSSNGTGSSGGGQDYDDDQSSLRVLLETWRLYDVGLRAYDTNDAGEPFGVRGGVLPTAATTSNTLPQNDLRSGPSIYRLLDDNIAMDWLRAQQNNTFLTAELLDALQNDYADWYYRSTSSENAQERDFSSARSSTAATGDDAFLMKTPRSIWLYASNEWPRAGVAGVSRDTVLREAARFAAHQAKMHFWSWLGEQDTRLSPLAGCGADVSTILQIVKEKAPRRLALLLGIGALLDRCMENDKKNDTESYLWSVNMPSSVRDARVIQLEAEQPVLISEYAPFSRFHYDSGKHPICLKGKPGEQQPRFLIVERAVLGLYYAVRPKEYLFDGSGSYRLFAVNYNTGGRGWHWKADLLWYYADEEGVSDANRSGDVNQWYEYDGQSREGFGSAIAFPPLDREHQAVLLWYELIE